MYRYNDAHRVDGVMAPLLTSKRRSDNTTGVKGVSEVVKKGNRLYRASITIDHRKIFLGEYSTVEEAARARKAGEERYHKPYLRGDQS